MQSTTSESLHIVIKTEDDLFAVGKDYDVKVTFRVGEFVRNLLRCKSFQCFTNSSPDSTTPAKSSINLFQFQITFKRVFFNYLDIKPPTNSSRLGYQIADEGLAETAHSFFEQGDFTIRVNFPNEGKRNHPRENGWMIKLATELAKLPENDYHHHVDFDLDNMPPSYARNPSLAIWRLKKYYRLKATFRRTKSYIRFYRLSMPA